MKTKATLFALTTLLLSSSAFASDLNGKSLKDDANYHQSEGVVNWGGAYVGGQFGYGIDIIGVEDLQGGAALEGILGGGKLGYDFARGRFLFGLYGEYNWTDINIGEEAVFENEWTIAARAGLIVAPRTMVYGLVGWTNATLAEAGGGESIDLDGIKAGGGVELALTGNIFANLEVTRTWYDLPEDAGDGITLEDTRAMAGLKIKLNGFGF
jgi:outer membrane immunogenic protein